jgi:hypothetical protein
MSSIQLRSPWRNPSLMDLGVLVRSLLVFTLALSVTASGQQPPETMTRVTVRLQSPEVPTDSFGAKPKVMYRAGTRYCRTEESPDPEQGIHGLVIINEPDVWMVNLLSKTARRFVDPGPTFNCRMPIFTEEQAKSAAAKPLDLEFGQELAYFTKIGVTPERGPVIQDQPTAVYATKASESQLFLFMIGTPQRPRAVARQRGSTREIVWYGAYEQLPFDPKLFAKPDGVTIEEARQ